ncbi:DUF1206 domain-containing protein [Streptomyces wedmorensis]|uniref:DUF1206 domain-containing protein n=1 Tax=Streptomyces wedmorensis TaxID=43759 RepID=UPI00343033AB
MTTEKGGRDRDGASGEGSTDRQSRDLTARLLELPGGRWWVGAVAAGVLVAGLWIAGHAVLRKYWEELERERLTVYQRRLMDVAGVAGGRRCAANRLLAPDARSTARRRRTSSRIRYRIGASIRWPRGVTGA